MQCPHCCFDCQMSGQTMSMKTFRQSLRLFKQLGKIEYNSHITIGGGEPTLHPHIKTIVANVSMCKNSRFKLITNGRLGETALFLLTHYNKHISLSVDRYHEPIDQSIIDIFKKSFTYKRNLSRNSSVKEHHNIVNAANPIRSGRSRKGPKDCACQTLFIKPNGQIKYCGCLNSPVIGHVKERLTYKLTSIIKRQQKTKAHNLCYNRYYEGHNKHKILKRFNITK